MTITAATRPTDRKRAAGLTLAALGVVYGDIGTSPLYTFPALLPRPRRSRYPADAETTSSASSR